MSNVSLTGLPANSTLPKLVRSLKNLLDKKKFWIRELSDVYGSDTKQAVIEFPTSHEARYAAQCLNKQEFEYAGHRYPLLAEIQDDVRRPSLNSERRRSPSRYGDSHSYHDKYGSRSIDRDYYLSERDRSRSPVRYHNESSKLDMEIELLRKQRMIIEEERKLLLERKKLELIREYGPSAVQDLVYMDEERDRERRRRPIRAERHPIRAERHPIRADRHPAPRSRPRTPPPPRYSKNRDTVVLPLFVLPCKKLLSEMKELTSKAASKESYPNLLNLLRVTIRKRLAVALVGKPRLSSPSIIKIYRDLYPSGTDEELVRRTLATLKDGHIIENESGKEDSVEENGNDNSDIEDPNPVAVSEPPVANVKEEPRSKGNQEQSAAARDIKNESTLSLEALAVEATENQSTLSLEAPLKEVTKTEPEDWPKGETEWSQDQV